jgi:hypothetical protein
MGRPQPPRKGWPAPADPGIMPPMYPTLPFKETLSCTLGQSPVAIYPAGVLVAGLVAMATARGFVRLTWSLSRTEIEVQTDRELEIEELAQIAGLCTAYDAERARAYPS